MPMFKASMTNISLKFHLMGVYLQWDIFWQMNAFHPFLYLHAVSYNYSLLFTEVQPVWSITPQT